jgi:mRNA-degrading endonuclease toxin of MazEF toxin-antitoxin module
VTPPTFAPEPDGLPDPGEVVWTWVPYEDDPAQGKDRPVVVLSRVGAEGTGQLLCLQLTSQDHDRDAEDEARWGRYWMDIGTGAWDSDRRPSEVRLDRLLVLPEADVRREGAALERSVFDAVVAAATRHHPQLAD